MYSVSIDPGTTKATGISIWLDGQLQVAMVMRPRGSLYAFADRIVDVIMDETGWELDLGWIETQEQHEKFAGSSAVVDGLIRLATFTGMIRGMVFARCGAELDLVRPSAWKGSLPKKHVVEHRVKQELSVSEQAAVHTEEREDLTTDLYDSIGIGLFGLGRVGRGVH